MDYFDDVFISFLDKDSILYIFNGGTESSRTKWRFYGLERHEGESLMTSFSFLCELTL